SGPECVFETNECAPGCSRTESGSTRPCLICIPRRALPVALNERMPKRCTQLREVLLLVDVQEFSYNEAAEILQIPIGTMTSRLSQARELAARATRGCRQASLPVE